MNSVTVLLCLLALVSAHGALAADPPQDAKKAEIQAALTTIINTADLTDVAAARSTISAPWQTYSEDSEILPLLRKAACKLGFATAKASNTWDDLSFKILSAISDPKEWLCSQDETDALFIAYAKYFDNEYKELPEDADLDAQDSETLNPIKEMQPWVDFSKKLENKKGNAALSASLKRYNAMINKEKTKRKKVQEQLIAQASWVFKAWRCKSPESNLKFTVGKPSTKQPWSVGSMGEGWHGSMKILEIIPSKETEEITNDYGEVKGRKTIITVEVKTDSTEEFFSCFKLIKDSGEIGYTFCDGGGLPSHDCF